MSVQTVGRYQVIGELGRGAMGLVYKAQDPTIGRTVALKTMRLDVHGLESDEVLRRFKNEARAAGLLNHPNIITTYDAGEQDGMFYIAMEFMEGITLQQVLSQKRLLAPEEIVRIARQVCQGLDFAHAAGIIHRDIKPANIMMAPDGTAKIMDFGIAKAGAGMTSTGQVLGTPNYMSPEQVKGKELDGRSDFFSFGVILYEMVTGEKPFVGQNVTTIVYKIVHENPIAPRDLDVTVHPGLSMVVTKCLAKAPDERYQSGGQLIKDLENYKSAGTDLSSTAVLSATVLNANNPTQVLAQPQAGNATGKNAARTDPVTQAVPAKPAAVAPPPTAAALPKASKKRGAMIVVLAGVLVLAAVGGYFLYLYRTTKKMQESNRALEEKIAQEQREQSAAAAAIKAEETKPQEGASPTPSPQPQTGPSAADPAQSQIDLRVDSKPPGANVEIDHRSDAAWVTPFKVSNLGSGKHTLAFSKPGYTPETRSISVAAGKPVTFSLTLSPLATRLAVDSTPQGASIEVDGQATDQVTPAFITVQKGDHNVVLRKVGYTDVSTTQTVDEGQTANVSQALALPTIRMERPGFLAKIFGGGGQPAIPSGKGVVRINTAPQGATIQIGDKTGRLKTPALWITEPGTYDIVLSMDGFQTVSHRVQVVKGRPTPVDEVLQKLR